MSDTTSTPGLSLPEAITRMLKGEVMVDADGDFYRIVREGGAAFAEWKDSGPDRNMGWLTASSFYDDDGWRVATPEELAEIER